MYLQFIEVMNPCWGKLKQFLYRRQIPILPITQYNTSRDDDQKNIYNAKKSV